MQLFLPCTSAPIASWQKRLCVLVFHVACWDSGKLMSVRTNEIRGNLGQYHRHCNLVRLKRHTARTLGESC